MHSGIRIIQIRDDETQQMCLLGAAKIRKQLLDRAQGAHT